MMKGKIINKGERSSLFFVNYLDTIAAHAATITSRQTQTAGELDQLKQGILHKAFEGGI